MLAEALATLDRDLQEISNYVRASKAALTEGVNLWLAGDHVAGAQKIELACSLEYEAFGSCESCGHVEGEIQRAHVGGNADYCETEGCPVCGIFNREDPDREVRSGAPSVVSSSRIPTEPAG